MKHEEAINSAAPAKLELVVGAGKGKTYDFFGDSLSIGRSDQNDIVLASESVSRNHAILYVIEDGSYSIKDNASKNGVIVNGTQVSEAILSDGDLIQIGDFAFRFFLAHHESPNSVSELPIEAEATPYPTKKRTKPKKSAGPANRRPLIYGVVVIVIGAAYYYSTIEEKPKGSPDDTSKGSVSTTANTAIASATTPTFNNPSDSKNIAGIEDPLLSATEQRLDKVEMGNNTIRESEQYFKKGLREYENKNYLRAMDDFKSASTLYRAHPLANYYYQLSLYAVETDAKKNFEYGRKYFESMQFNRAIFHFNMVLSLMEHRPTDPMVAASQKYILISKRQLQAAEQYP